VEQSFIIESIDLDQGFYSLVTAVGQSDLATSVQGYDAIVFHGQYMLAGGVKHHSQYVFDIRKTMMRDWVYRKTFANSPMIVGDVVRYEGTRKHPHYFSSLVLHETLPSSISVSLTLVVAGSAMLFDRSGTCWQNARLFSQELHR
jgi:hypothetical protein